MMLSTIYLAAEDLPGLAVGRRLVAEHKTLMVYREENAQGFGRLKGKVSNYHQMGAQGFPVLMLTDLDTDPCPSVKVQSWLGQQPSRGFLFRICVREVEAWLLADREAMAAFLSIRADALPAVPEQVSDPKSTLLQLALRAPRKRREGLVPAGKATIGPEYNEMLSGFIRDSWSIDRASLRAPSLVRARQRVAELASMVDT